MSSARTTAQLPQSTTVSVHSKSHVLAGVQDAYWSDDENEDAECPLCMEPMDVSDLGFRPCPCGYQICSFCWNHIKQNLNGRCPACRREYTDDAVEFTKIPGEEMKRLNQQKKIKERERKDIEQLGRKQYLNVRIVQRNHVYVVGLGPRLAKEEFIPSLRSNDYFGQYGKISKILLVKRNQAGSAPVTGLYVTYHRREDAARAIQAVDGTPTPGGNGEIMRASHGTTKYCMSFLRNVSCSQPGCMDMHDWADERDCFTKEDLTSLKHTMKDTELGKLNGRRDDGSALPRSAAWAQKGASTPSTPSGLPPPLPRSRQGRESQRERTRNKDSQGTPATVRSRGGQQTRLITAIAPKPIPASLASPTGSSRPSTPARITTPENVPALPQLTSQTLLPPTSPPPPARSPDSVAQESEGGSSAPGGVLPTTLPHVPLEVVQSPPPPIPSAPPGLPPPTRGPYHMSTQAQALIDDVRARREVSQSSTSNAPSPFPDFDRTLASLGDDGTSFSFSLDQALAGGIGADLELEHELAFGSSIAAAFDPFAVQPHGLKTAALLGQPTGLSGPPGLAGPPGLGGPPGLPAPPGLTSPMADGFGSSMAPSSSSLATLNGFNGLNGAPLVKSTYSGSFNPFDMEPADALKRGPGGPDDMRGVSRFGFARGRQATTSATTSPFLGHSPLDSDVIGDGRRLNMAQQLGELPGPLPIQQVSPWGNLQQAPQAQHQQPQQHQHQQPRHHHQQQQHQQQQQQQHHYQQQNHQPPMHHQPAQHSQLPNQMRYPPGIVPQHLLQAQQYLQQQQQQQQQHQQQQEQPQLSRYGAGNMGGAGATFAPFDDYRPPAAQAQAQVPSGMVYKRLLASDGRRTLTPSPVRSPDAQGFHQTHAHHAHTHSHGHHQQMRIPTGVAYNHVQSRR
ncbi:hypothetical protein BKA62DRAFT_129145 [Auriculariales sp. MPI-PUGE-AT-0066]|nr:hypothetical protein BKA62DRAFT_129145 [Auriculariales sp. MPI-PUGE-AT-0066]